MIQEIRLFPLIETLRLQNVDDDKYFSEKYNGYISNSRLSLINPEQDNDPKAFFEGLSKHNKYSDSLLLGSAVHGIILQKEQFEIAPDINRPSSKLGFVADEIYKYIRKNNINNESLSINNEDLINVIIEAVNKIDYYKSSINSRIQSIIDSCKEYWIKRKSIDESKPNKRQLYLNTRCIETSNKCIKALNNDKSIQKLLHPKGLFDDPISANERTVLLDIKVEINDNSFILRLKAKLDNYTIDKETDTIVVNDLKTTSGFIYDFENNFDKYHYAREITIYAWLLSLVAQKHYKMSNFKIKSNCLVVSTIPQNYTNIYELTKSDFIKGWNEFVYLLKLVAYYYNIGYTFV